MSSSARKRESGYLNQIHLRSVSRAQGAAVSEILERVTSLLRALLPNGDYFVSHAGSETCTVEIAQGIFAPLSGKTLEVPGDGNSSFDSRELAKWIGHEPGEGDGACFRLHLTGDQSAVIGVWRSQGLAHSDLFHALASVTQLATEASRSSDLELDLQAQRLRAETMRSEVEQLQHFYRRFSNAISQCFWVLDIDQPRVQIVSENFERVWGARPEILHEGLSGFMSSVLPADRDRVLSEFHTHLGAELSTEFRVVADTEESLGEVRWIWLRAFPLPSTEALGRRVVFIADDITEKKSEEEVLRSREADLVSRARLQAIGDLASGVAHEINNPLTIIVGKASEVKRIVSTGHPRPEDISVIAAYADKIQKTSIRISEIVQSLKFLSRPEKHMSIHRHPFYKIFQELRDMCSERFKAHGVLLEIPEPPPELAAEINPTLVSQMLLNLINNAHDAVEKERNAWVRVEWAEDDDSIYLFVTDSGPGIPIKIRSRIFDPFFTTKDPGKGTGLGLSLAASIAAHHQGSLRLDNLHTHTRFAIQLPKRSTG